MRKKPPMMAMTLFKRSVLMRRLRLSCARDDDKTAIADRNDLFTREDRVAIPDVTSATYGFSVPVSARDRRFALVGTRVSRIWERLQRLVALGGAALIFLVAALWRWQPSLSRCATGLLLAFVWLAVLWSLDRRYRLGALEVPEALVKRGLSGVVISRQIVAKARPLLTLPLEPVPFPIDFTPPFSAEIAGTKLSFAQVAEMVRAMQGVFSNSIQGEVTAEGDGFSIRFTIERESRTSMPVRLGAGWAEADFVAAARALILFAAPFHAGCVFYLAGDLRGAAELVHSAGRDGRYPAKMRAACWRLMALMRAERGELERAARALHMAESSDPANAVTPAMVVGLLGAKASLTDDVAALSEIRAAQCQYRRVGDIKGAASEMATRFSIAVNTAIINSGRVRGLARLEARLNEERSRFDQALSGALPPDLGAWQADHSLQVFAEVIGRMQSAFRPGPDDSGQFLDAYKRACERASEVVALVQRSVQELAALRAAAESWKRAVEEEKEHARELNSELYKQWVEDERRAGEKMKGAEQQLAESKRLRAVVDETSDWLKQQTALLREEAARVEALRVAWDAAEATPFED